MARVSCLSTYLLSTLESFSYGNDVVFFVFFFAPVFDFASGGQLQYGVNPNLTHFFTKECTYERKRRYQ